MSDKPTPFQREIAKALGISLRGATIQMAAARIRDRVALAIDPDTSFSEPTEKQVKFATDLGVYVAGDSFHVCAVKIQAELTRRNEEALRRLDLKPGDEVEYYRCSEYDGEVDERRSQHIVSSVGKNLRVYFKNP